MDFPLPIFALKFDEIPGFVKADLVYGKIVLTMHDLNDLLHPDGAFTTTVYGDCGDHLGPTSMRRSRGQEQAVRQHIMMTCLLVKNAQDTPDNPQFERASKPYGYSIEAVPATKAERIKKMRQENAAIKKLNAPIVVQSKFNVGDVVRYGIGPTALMRIESISPNHGAHHRYYGVQYYGDVVGAYENECSAATKAEVKRFETDKHIGRLRDYGKRLVPSKYKKS
jgi:hypothetical protein